MPKVTQDDAVAIPSAKRGATLLTTHKDTIEHDRMHDQEEEYQLMEMWYRHGFMSGYEVLQ